MPNIKSAKKRVLVTKKQALNNQMRKSALKTSIKNLDVAVASGDKAVTEVAFKDAISKLDKAAQKNIIHKNAAAHKKSQITTKAMPVLTAKTKASKTK